jgi:hypothetical protein
MNASPFLSDGLAGPSAGEASVVQAAPPAGEYERRPSDWRGAATAVAGQPPWVGGFEESAGVLCSASLAEVRSAQNRRSMFSWAFLT